MVTFFFSLFSSRSLHQTDLNTFSSFSSLLLYFTFICRSSASIILLYAEFPRISVVDFCQQCFTSPCCLHSVTCPRTIQTSDYLVCNLLFGELVLLQIRGQCTILVGERRSTSSLLRVLRPVLANHVSGCAPIFHMLRYQIFWNGFIVKIEMASPQNISTNFAAPLCPFPQNRTIFLFVNLIQTFILAPFPDFLQLLFRSAFLVSLS